MTWMDEVFRFVMTGRKSDGVLDECQLDADKNLKVVVVATMSPPGAPTARWDDPPGMLSERVVRAAPSTLLQLFGFSETYGFLHVFDASTVPPDGTRPAIALPIWGFGSPFALPLNAQGRDFSNGIVWAFSSTPAILTRDATAQIWANAQTL